MDQGQPNQNVNENENQSNSNRGFVSNEMADFSCLIANILEYYYSKEPVDSGEEWKKDANMIPDQVDPEVDENVKEAFNALLKRYQ